MKVLVKAIKERPDFKNIDLDNNNFSGDTITELFSILPLSKINLTKNVLTEQQITPLSKQIKTNRSLQQIYLSHNQLSDGSVAILADGMKDNNTLTELFMTHNDLSGMSGEAFIKSLAGKSALKSLALNNCRIGLIQIRALAEVLKDND